MKPRGRSLKQDQVAKRFDQEIQPIWSHHFGRLALRELRLPPAGVVLDLGCAAGWTTLELVRRLGPEGRVIAIDTSAPLLALARRRAGDAGGKRVFFRAEEHLVPLGFADSVYDHVLCEEQLDRMDDPVAILRELARVTKPGRELRAVLTLRGTWSAFYDLYREVLIKHGLHEILARMEAAVLRHPEADTALSWVTAAGLSGGDLEIEPFTLLFRSAREFFFAPLIETGPLATWKAIAGKGREMQDVFWYIKEAIDLYFSDRAFAVEVVAGCLRAVKPGA